MMRTAWAQADSNLILVHESFERLAFAIIPVLSAMQALGFVMIGAVMITTWSRA